MRQNFSGAYVRDARAMTNWELMQVQYCVPNVATASYSQRIHLTRMLNGGVYSYGLTQFNV